MDFVTAFQDELYVCSVGCLYLQRLVKFVVLAPVVPTLACKLSTLPWLIHALWLLSNSSLRPAWQISSKILVDFAPASFCVFNHVLMQIQSSIAASAFNISKESKVRTNSRCCWTWTSVLWEFLPAYQTPSLSTNAFLRIQHQPADSDFALFKDEPSVCFLGCFSSTITLPLHHAVFWVWASLRQPRQRSI